MAKPFQGSPKPESGWTPRVVPKGSGGGAGSVGVHSAVNFGSGATAFSPATLEPTERKGHPTPMTDAPSRVEIDAKLEAAEGRTEARFAELKGDVNARFAEMRGDMDVRFSQMNGKVDLLAHKIDGLTQLVDSTLKVVASENKSTRSTMIVTGIGSVLAVLALIITLWAAGLSMQANMLSSFQAGLSAVSTSIAAKPAGNETPPQPSPPK